MIDRDKLPVKYSRPAYDPNFYPPQQWGKISGFADYEIEFVGWTMDFEDGNECRSQRLKWSAGSLSNIDISTFPVPEEKSSWPHRILVEIKHRKHSKSVEVKGNHSLELYDSLEKTVREYAGDYKVNGWRHKHKARFHQAVAVAHRENFVLFVARHGKVYNRPV